jgi:hypothetical protein
MSSSSAWALFWRAFQAGGFSERPSLFQRKDYPGLGVSIESVFGATVRSSLFSRLSSLWHPDVLIVRRAL